MPWQCVMRDEPPDWGNGERPAIGEMWYEPEPHGQDRPPNREPLSAQYERDWAGRRPPIVIALPGVSRHGYRTVLLDGAYFGGPDVLNPNREGWTITGTPPNLTATPSIHAVGDYHGWLRDGVLSDDVDGRTYPASAEAHE